MSDLTALTIARIRAGLAKRDFSALEPEVIACKYDAAHVCLFLEVKPDAGGKSFR